MLQSYAIIGTAKKHILIKYVSFTTDLKNNKLDQEVNARKKYLKDVTL